MGLARSYEKGVADYSFSLLIADDPLGAPGAPGDHVDDPVLFVLVKPRAAAGFADDQEE
ncbi:MAG TPA: hypothetical protein VIH75_04830 [Candidatus Sulfotelmatobacter sp.]|jgi:hypothetical protein